MSDELNKRAIGAFGAIAHGIRSAFTAADNAAARAGAGVGRFVTRPKQAIAYAKARNAYLDRNVLPLRRMQQDYRSMKAISIQEGNRFMARASDDGIDVSRKLAEQGESAARKSGASAAREISNKATVAGGKAGRAVFRASAILGGLGLASAAGRASGKDSRVAGKDGRAGRDGDGDGIFNEGKKK